MKRTKITLLSLFVLVSLMLGACASAQESAYESPPLDPSTDMGVTSWESEESAAYDDSYDMDESKDAGGTNNAVDRMMIYNANLEIAVVDPDGVMQAIITLAEDEGGFVVSSYSYKTYSDDRTLPRANLTVRVPAEKLEAIMEDIKALTPDPEEDVISENVAGEDVTSEYTDLGSRLRNLEAAEEALVTLMEDARDPEDVLAIFDELTYYRGEIEIVKGRMKYLEESADLSALTVSIIAKESLQPIEIVGWQPKGTAKRAIEALIEAIQFLGDAVIWLGIYCLPFLIPLGIGVYFLVKLIRRKRAAKKAAKMEVVEGSEAES